MKIATEDFARLAASAAKVANDKHANPVAKFVRLEASGGKLRATATDFDYWLERSAPCDGDLPVLLVAAKQLDEVAKALKADTLDVTADATHLHIKAGKSKRKLAIQPADAFPTLPEVDGEGVSVERAALMTALEFCQPYVDAGRGQVFGGVHISNGNSYATDGKAMARYAHGLDMPGVTLATAFIKALSDNLPDGEIAIVVGERRIEASWSEGSVAGPLVEGQYPDVERIIPRDASTTIAVDCDALSRAVAGVKALSDGRNLIALDVGDSVTLTGRATDGEATDELDATRDGKPLSIGFNAMYLERIGKGFAKQGLHIEMNGDSAAAKITSPDDDRKLVVVMPMRI